MFTSGNLLQTHPELFQAITSKFPGLSSDRLKRAEAVFWLTPEAEPHFPFGQIAHPRQTALNYFFVQTPPDLSGAQSVQIPLADALRRIREVHYDRGTIVNAMDIEAKEMADCRKRYDSFNKSELLRGKVEAYQLSQLGFFFVGDRNSPGKLRCSFCRRTIHMFTTDDTPYLEKNFDRRLIALLHRHSHLSATCPFSLSLNGDDKRFTADVMARAVEPLIRTQAVQISRVEIGSVPPMDSAPLRIFGASLLSQFPNGLPPFDGEISNPSIDVRFIIKFLMCFFSIADGDLSNAYYKVLAELEYELFSPLETEPDFESEIGSFVDDLTPQASPIDYFIGVEPKYKSYISIRIRIDSFEVEAWRQQPLSRENSPLLKPAYFARVGFFYSGTSDNVMCFWCGLGLNHWETTDDPATEHIRFTPRCTWLLRMFGRQRVKYIYLQTNGSQTGAAAVQNIKPTDYSFIRDVEDIAGT